VEGDATEVKSILENQMHEQEEEKEAAAKRHRREVIKNKIRFMGRMSRMLKTIR
jgi:hypothetical protein